MAKLVTFQKTWNFSLSVKKVFSKSLLFLGVGDMIYVCFYLVLSISSVFTICIQSDLSLDMAKMVTFQKAWNFSLSVKKVFSKSLFFSRDVGVMRYFCFFLVLSSSSVCSIYIQHDLSLDMAKMVTFEKNLKLLFVSKKKSSLKVFYFSRCRWYEICMLFRSS